jgi:hypothetical protein
VGRFGQHGCLCGKENSLNIAGPILPLQTPGDVSPPAPDRHEISSGIAVAIVLWIAVVGSGTIGMTRYANSPGISGQAPAVWPADSHIPFDAGRPTLVMFTHPRCPCTRASLGELELLLAQFPRQVNTYVVVLKPADTTTNWEKTDLWRTASSIPGVTVCTDNDGMEARRFHSETSGQTLFYDRSGVLRFQGGITLSRGHAGDNPGRTAVEEWLRQGHSDKAKTPVFGCSLFEEKCLQGDTLCKP